LQPGYSEEPGPICPNCTMTKAPGWITIAAGPEVTDERYLNLLLPEVDDDGDSDDELVLDPEVYVSDEEDSSDSDGDERHVVWLANRKQKLAPRWTQAIGDFYMGRLSGVMCNGRSHMNTETCMKSPRTENTFPV